MRHAVAGLTAVLLAVAAPTLPAQQTRAERSGSRETSTHADVLGFLDSLGRAGAPMRRGVLATSAQGREVPWVLLGRPIPADPAEAHRSGKPVVWVQGNIHGGEVEGKEATQMLIRDLTVGPLRPLLDSLIVLVVPIYNTDGNDALGPGDRHRPGQAGPEVVGRRPNGQGLDLNRDYIKQEAPETRGAARLLNAWDPDLIVDLHTTNGSYHGYVLTYAAGLNPNSPPANEYLYDRFLPEVRARMRSRHRQEVYWYGNFRNQEPDSLALGGWETYDPRPRFGINWYAMRNRLAILSEAYSNADFATRISASYHFALEILRLAAEERATIKRLTGQSWRPDSLAVQSRLAPPVMDSVVAELTHRAGQGAGPFARRQRTGQFRTVWMPVYGRFEAARREAMPSAWLLPPQHSHLVDRLRAHGVLVEELRAPWSGPVEAFRVDSIAAAPNPFEGHRTVSVSGVWVPRPAEITAGWFLVPARQRLGVLAGYLLEPASEDGFVTWNLLDRDLRRGTEYPILRVAGVVTVPAVRVP